MLWSAKIRRSFWVFVINQGKSVMISTQVIESLGKKISLKTITISQQEEKMRKIKLNFARAIIDPFWNWQKL